MFTFHFVNFYGSLDIQPPSYEGIPNDSPIFIYYTEKEDLSKHEIFRRFYKILKENQISYLRPNKHLTDEWFFDLREFKHNFSCLKRVEYLNGTTTIELEYLRNITKINSEEETSIKISIYQEDFNLFKDNKVLVSEELSLSLQRFRKDYPIPEKCGFLMMKFEDSKIQKEIISTLKNHLSDKGISLLRADDKWYADDLFENIKTYMQGCSFGIAIFDRVNTEEFNPNVSLEIGYLMALNKPVLLLKDKTLRSLQTDLVGKLYHQFDFQYPNETIPLVLDKWINDKEIL